MLSEPRWVGVLGQVRDLPQRRSHTGGMSEAGNRPSPGEMGQVLTSLGMALTSGIRAEGLDHGVLMDGKQVS